MTHHTTHIHPVRRSPLALTVLAVLAVCAGPAAAQSNVTIFGVLDIGVQRISGGNKSLKLQSIDGLQTSRLGFRGSEDMGGGLRAGFHLEGAIAPDTGGGFDFRRRSTVSISKDGIGELRLGRDYTPTFWNISRFNAFGTNGVGAASNLIYGFDGLSGSAKTVVRSDNAVGYFLPSGLGGVYGQAMLAAGEGSTGKYAGLRVGYAAGPVDVAASVSDTDNNVAGDKFRVSSVGGTFDAGVAKLFGLVHNSKQTTREQNNWVVGANMPLGQAILRASYTHAHLTNSATNADYTGKQLALGGIYNLSKRTALYSTWSRVQNSSTGKFVIAGAPAITAGQGSSAVEAGVYHAF